MTVFDNVAFGLRMKSRKERLSKTDIAEKVHSLLKLVQLDWLADRFPSQLSGGQRQRIALARALAVEPKVLLLDEPFGALDAKVRKELRRWLRRLHDELNMTSIFVTHDQEEALEVADRVVLMNQGQVEQVGAPSEVYQHPATPFVYGFLGSSNVFSGQNGQIFARPHEIDIHLEQNSINCVPATVTRLLTFGLSTRVELDSIHLQPPQHFDVELGLERANLLDLQVGQPVHLSARTFKLFPAVQS
jgi:sulfate transport system ATP-binding protein